MFLKKRKNKKGQKKTKVIEVLQVEILSIYFLLRTKKFNI